VIASARRTRLIFEPFNEELRASQRAGMARGLYIEPGTENLDIEAIVTAALAGRIRGRRVNQFNYRRISTRRVLKDVSSSNLIPWLSTRFPEVPIIYLVRNPLDAAWSYTKCRMGSPLGAYSRRTELFSDVFSEQWGQVRETLFKESLITWCLDNSIPLRTADWGRVHLVSYEELCADPDDEIERLTAYLRGFEGVWCSWKPEGEWINQRSGMDIIGYPALAIAGGIEDESEFTPGMEEIARSILQEFGFVGAVEGISQSNSWLSSFR
jgi:hypothetical protein